MLQTGDIAWIGTAQIGVRTLFFIEPDEGAGIDEQGTQPVILGLRTVADINVFRFAVRPDLIDPLLQRRVSDSDRFRPWFLTSDCIGSGTCR
ncbi:hypothetical protein D3C86_1860320 [compost metagenome]